MVNVITVGLSRNIIATGGGWLDEVDDCENPVTPSWRKRSKDGRQPELSEDEMFRALHREEQAEAGPTNDMVGSCYLSI
jgi:hypothetical protein